MSTLDWAALRTELDELGSAQTPPLLDRAPVCRDPRHVRRAGAVPVDHRPGTRRRNAHFSANFVVLGCCSKSDGILALTDWIDGYARSQNVMLSYSVSASQRVTVQWVVAQCEAVVLARILLRVYTRWRNVFGVAVVVAPAGPALPVDLPVGLRGLPER